MLSCNNNEKIASKPNRASTNSSPIHVPSDTEQSKSSGSWPLYALSVLWVTLCSGLVFKHPQLITVFFAFLASWVVAVGVFVTTKAVTTTTTGASAAAPRRVKTAVGLLACFLQCGYLLTATTGDDGAYQALSVAAGYLAFDHWFSAIYGIEKSLAAVMEDAVTLTTFLVVLVVWKIHRQDGNDTTIHSMLLIGPTTFAAWTVYKMIRFVFDYDDLPKDPTTSKKGADIPSSPSTSQQVWSINGVNYNMTSFVDSHPGGKEAILLGRGRDDCTALFQSYHPFTATYASKVLHKYRLPASQQSKGAAVAVNDDEFYNTLCQRVSKTLLEEHKFDPVLDRAATPRRTVYYILVLAAVVKSSVAHCRGSVLGSFLLAVFGWLIGALGHDGGHFSVSRRWPAVNDWAVWGISFLCNPVLWQHQHTFAHHSHTNSFDRDPDLHHFSLFLRVHRRFQQSSWYRLQSNRIFVFFAYTFVVFGTCFWIPWGMISEGSLYGMVEWTDRQRPLRTAGMYLHLFGYTGFIFVLPFLVHDSWLSAFQAVIVHVSTSGLLFAIFSQINHLNEGSLDPDQFHKRHLKRDAALNNSWAVRQIETSNNFCPDSALWHVLSNGLNLQIEHHLFPGLNHCHLHLVQPTVQAVCEEYGICYKNYDSWSDLMRATLEWLDRLSVEPELTESEPEKETTKLTESEPEKETTKLTES